MKLLPAFLRFRRITDVVSIDRCLTDVRNRTVYAMNRAVKTREETAEFRHRVVQALWADERSSTADAVNACMQYWSGRPLPCRRPRLCTVCLAWRLDQLCKSDVARLHKRRAKRPNERLLLLTAVAPPRSQQIAWSAWRRVVVGFRRLYLAQSRAHRWIVAATEIDPVIRVLGPADETTLSRLGPLYRQLLDELIQLGPEAAVAHYLETRRAIRLFMGAGLFRGPADRAARLPSHTATRLGS